MPNWLRPYLSRIVAPLILWVLEQVAIRLRAPIPQEGHRIFWFLVIILILYGIVHKIIEKWVNPLDVSTTESAKQSAGAP